MLNREHQRFASAYLMASERPQMKPSTYSFSSLTISLLMGAAACGDDGGDGNSDALAEIGFATPMQPTTAFEEVNGIWEERGAADWSCLNSTGDETATTTDVVLSGTVLDFQTDEALPSAELTLYGDAGITGPELGSATADELGEYQLTLPSGQTHWAFKIVAENALETYQLNQHFQPDQAEQEHVLESVSVLTAQALPAFIGVTRTPGLGIVAGSVRDCRGYRVLGAVAAMSDAPEEANHLAGAVSYYFSALSTSLPVRHSQQAMTNKDGVFVTIELPPGAERYVQVWGFVDDADLADGEMTLLSQVASPIIADAVVTVSLRPRQQ